MRWSFMIVNMLMFVSEDAIGAFELLELLPALLLPLLYLLAVLLPVALFLLLFPLQLLQQQPPLLLLSCDLLQEFPLLDLVPFELLLLPPLLLSLVLPHPPLHLDPVLLLHLELLLEFGLVLVHLSFSVVVHLVQQVYSCLLSLLPLLLLLLLLLHPLQVDQSVQLLLIGLQSLVFALHPSQRPPCLLPFFLLHELLILSQLPLFEHYPFYHLSIPLLLHSNGLFFLCLYSKVLLVYGLMDALLPLSLLEFFLFDG